MIDEKRILQNLKEFSFPRLSGTRFEKNSFNMAKKKVEDLNLSPIVQEFSFSIFYSRIYPKFALTLLSWILVVLLLNINLIFNIINLCIDFIFMLILIIYTRSPEKIKLGHEYSSQNLFAKLSSQAKQESSDYNILLFSHLDSKGQAFSIKIRIQLYYVWIITFPLGLLITIINSFLLIENYLFIDILAILTVSINFLSTVILWINTTNNRSKGAIDDASGISCVLELLKFYSNIENRLMNYDLWFVFTGAEESGTMGIRNFYNHIKNFDKDKTFIINFDSIAKKVNLWDHGLLNKKNYKSFNYILENEDIMSLEKKTHKFYIGTYSDGLFLLNKGFKGLGNGDKSIYKFVHSENDDFDKINEAVLKKLCEFYTILLNEVDCNLNN